MQARDIPNLITVFRFLLVTPVVWAMLDDRFGLALLLFGIAGLSDAVDGYLAKRNNWSSRLSKSQLFTRPDKQNKIDRLRNE